jgi:hypothetical protein
VPLTRHSQGSQDYRPSLSASRNHRLTGCHGLTVDGLGKKLDQTPEQLRPGRVVVAILTDGIENASQRYTASMIAERIKHQREKYAWEFIFMAANQDAVLSGTALGVDRQDCTTFAATDAGVRLVCRVASDRIVETRRRDPSN